VNEPRNTPTKVEPSNLPPGTTPGVTRRVAELTGMVEPSGFSDAVQRAAGPDHTSEPAELRDPTPEEATQHVAAQGGAEDVAGIPDDPEGAIEEEVEREALGPNDRGEPRRLTPLEEAALTEPTRERDEVPEDDGPGLENGDEENDDIGTDDGFARAWREAMQLGPAHVFMAPTDTSPEEYERRRKALEDARAILGPEVAGSVVGGSRARSVTDIVYVAEWLLDSSTPVRIPRFAGEEPTDG
jgi:hypothetical protein